MSETASHPFSGEEFSASSEDRSGRQSGLSRHVIDSVREKLASTGYHQLRRIDVAVEGDQIRLSGRVGRYYLLQVAQQAALEADGVARLKNDVVVVATAHRR